MLVSFDKIKIVKFTFARKFHENCDVLKYFDDTTNDDQVAPDMLFDVYICLFMVCPHPSPVQIEEFA